MKTDSQRLRDLLNVIHLDKGQYTEKHGIEKSTKDAMRRVKVEIADVVRRINRIERMWREVQDQVCAAAFRAMTQPIRREKRKIK